MTTTLTTILNPRTYTIAPLSTTNYSSWGIKLEMLLICSKIWSVADGSKVAIADIDVNALETWKLKDSKDNLTFFSIMEKCN